MLRRNKVEENREYLRSIIGVNRSNQIDWVNSIGKEIECEYDRNKRILKIVKYESRNGEGYLYFEGYGKGILASHLIKCSLGRVLNVIWYKAPWMIDLGVSEKDSKTHTYNSSKKIFVKCPHCGRIKESVPNNIYIKHSIQCPCGDGISYPEKFMESVLIQLNIKYERQYKTDWSQTRIYDFYLTDYDTIIETHGKQHYEESSRGRSLKEEQENDKLKEELALKNGIKNYIIIDCRESELEHIKNNILYSELNKLSDLRNINWVQCEEYALKNKVKEVCDYKKENPEISTADLAKKFGMNRSTVTKYLKSGAKLGWCGYNTKEEMRRGSKLGAKLNSKLISQFTLDGEFIKTYPSAGEAERQIGIDRNNINNCCRGKRKTAGGFIWKFAEKK